jgi:hypothetical protein
LLEHCRNIKAGTAKAAHILAEQGTYDAQICHRGPLIARPAFIRPADVVAGLDGIVSLQIAAERVGQHLPVLIMLEVHWSKLQ